MRIGRPAASKVLAQWVADCAGTGTVLVQVGGPGVIDPDHHVAAYVGPGALDSGHVRGRTGRRLAGRLDIGQRSGRRRPSTTCSTGSTALTEPSVARTVARHLPPGAQLVVASSMPVRDLEWFGGPLARAHANRGANGIDGVVSTALGVALGGQPTIALVGDIALRPRQWRADRPAGTASRPAHRRRRQRRRRDLLVPAASRRPRRAALRAALRDAARHRRDRARPRPSPRRGDGHPAGGAGGPPRHRRVRPLTRIATDRWENVKLHKELNAAVAAAIG